MEEGRKGACIGACRGGMVLHGVGDPDAMQASPLGKFFRWDQLRCWPWLWLLRQQLLLQHHGLWNELRVLCTSGFSLWWSRQRHSSPWSTLHSGELPPGVSGSHTGRTLAATSVIPGTEPYLYQALPRPPAGLLCFHNTEEKCQMHQEMMIHVPSGLGRWMQFTRPCWKGLSFLFMVSTHTESWSSRMPLCNGVMMQWCCPNLLVCIRKSSILPAAPVFSDALPFPRVLTRNLTF